MATRAGDAITLHPDVTDAELADFLATSRVALIPLRAGAGVKLKVVEALAAGLPVVTTPTGAQGLPGLPAIADIAAMASMKETDRKTPDAAPTIESPSLRSQPLLDLTTRLEFRTGQHGGMEQYAPARGMRARHPSGSARAFAHLPPFNDSRRLP